MDDLLKRIASYVHRFRKPSKNALLHARLCLADALGCALLSLNYPECTKLLGPIAPGTKVPHGARIPGTSYILDPVQGAFNFGVMVRWLDYNDTFLAAEWAHPSDNLGALLPVMDYLSRSRKSPFLMKDLFLALIKTYEIQGSIGLLNSFNRVGFDHVILVKAASAAVACDLWGGTEKQVAETLSQVFIDTGPLRTYRHAPNTGPRKSWAAGDAASRGVHLAMLTMLGEPGYQTPLSAPRWGLQDVLFEGKPLKLEHKLGSYIIENVLFKVAFPAEFHAQTAVEAALQLHPHVKDRLQDISRVDIHTHEAALRIIDKKGPLRNFADRDHCMQYMVATALIHGDLTSDHYSDQAAEDARIDRLRDKMHLKEEPRFSKEYLHPDIRSIASRVTITLKDGTKLGPIAVEFPLGHRRRRREGVPLLWDKCSENLRSRLPKKKVDKLINLLQDAPKLESMPVSSFINLLI